jgi:hypothetical protein
MMYESEASHVARATPSAPHAATNQGEHIHALTGGGGSLNCIAVSFHFRCALVTSVLDTAIRLSRLSPAPVLCTIVAT